MSDRRTSPREPLSQPATIVLPDGGRIACRVIDRSARGVRLDVPDHFGLSGSVVLEGGTFGAGRRALIAWCEITREGAELGATLLEETAPPAGAR